MGGRRFLKSGFIRRRAGREGGFVFSFDSAMAVLIIVLAAALLSPSFLSPSLHSLSSLKRVGDDSLVFFDNSGFFAVEFDANSNAGAAQSIRARLSGLLPENSAAMVSVREYSLDRGSCSSSPSFSDCFSLSASASSGSPPAGDFVSGKRLFVHRRGGEASFYSIAYRAWLE